MFFKVSKIKQSAEVINILNTGKKLRPFYFRSLRPHCQWSKLTLGEYFFLLYFNKDITVSVLARYFVGVNRQTNT